MLRFGVFLISAVRDSLPGLMCKYSQIFPMDHGTDNVVRDGYRMVELLLEGISYSQRLIAPTWTHQNPTVWWRQSYPAIWQTMEATIGLTSIPKARLSRQGQ